jgi:L-asparaginase
MESSSIHILITGGTIDSVFDPAFDTNVLSDRTVILDFLKSKVKIASKVTHEVICLKDSRSITDSTREDLISAIKLSKTKNILITHGTYTMVESVKYLAQRHTDYKDYKIIFTGSFYPIRGYAESDAGFNLGYAIGAFSGVVPGVYLAMQGALFLPNEVQKNLELACFEHF